MVTEKLLNGVEGKKINLKSQGQNGESKSNNILYLINKLLALLLAH